jgi:hypothetical protein
MMKPYRCFAINEKFDPQKLRREEIIDFAENRGFTLRKIFGDSKGESGSKKSGPELLLPLPLEILFWFKCFFLCTPMVDCRKNNETSQNQENNYHEVPLIFYHVYQIHG